VRDNFHDKPAVFNIPLKVVGHDALKGGLIQLATPAKSGYCHLH